MFTSIRDISLIYFFIRMLIRISAWVTINLTLLTLGNYSAWNNISVDTVIIVKSKLMYFISFTHVRLTKLFDPRLYQYFEFIYTDISKIVKKKRRFFPTIFGRYFCASDRYGLKFYERVILRSFPPSYYNPTELIFQGHQNINSVVH